MKRTAKARYLELFDCYRATVGGRAVTMEEVSRWVFENRLYPVPSIRDALELHELWERRFAEVRKAVACAQE